MAQDYSTYPLLPTLPNGDLHSIWRWYSYNSFLSVWEFWSLFAIKSISIFTDRCCECNTVEKDHSAFCSASTVLFRKIFLNDTLYTSNNILVVWSLIIRDIYTQKDAWKVLFLVSYDLKNWDMNFDYKNYHITGVCLGRKLSQFLDISQNSTLEKLTLHKIQYEKNGLATKFYGVHVSCFSENASPCPFFRNQKCSLPFFRSEK